MCVCEGGGGCNWPTGLMKSHQEQNFDINKYTHAMNCS